MFSTLAPGFRKPRSWKEAPPLVERATPLKLDPPGPNKRLSKTLPESLNPTTTVFPHQAVEVSLCVNPPKDEKATSVVGSET
jgi:hypothetical protein